jgi:hypothetical protein
MGSAPLVNMDTTRLIEKPIIRHSVFSAGISAGIHAPAGPSRSPAPFRKYP